jgi:dsRNA-specific ribonuclease
LAKGIHLGATAGVTYDGHTFLNKNVKGTRFSNFDLRTKGLHLASVKTHEQPTQKDYQLLSYLGVSIFLLMINICLLHLYVRTDQVNSKRVTDGLTSLPSLWPGVWSRKSL